MDFIGAIATATKALEGLKLLMGLEKAFDAASFKMQIADITSNLADLKIALTEAKSEAAEKDAEISRLKQEFAFTSGSTVVVHDYRYQTSRSGGPQGIPFCTRCEKVDGLLMKLAKTTQHRTLLCPQCKSVFMGATVYGYDDPAAGPSALSLGT
jgi:hypothetical protein